MHFLRKQVHTESNNTLIGLTLSVFKFWSDGMKENLRSILPNNVYDAIDTESQWFTNVHDISVMMSEISCLDPEDLLMLSRDDFDKLIVRAVEKLGLEPVIGNREHSRLMDIRDLYAFLREKYSFESVNIFNSLRGFPFIADKDIDEFEKAYREKKIGKSLKMIYAFMEKLKEIIFNPQESEGWENIYHNRHPFNVRHLPREQV